MSALFAEVTRHGFMLTAAVTGLIVGTLSAVLSFFVVQRGLAFAGAGISHAAFGGLALGVYLDQPPLPFGVAFALMSALLLAHGPRLGRMPPDVAIGIAFSGSMALGVVLMSAAHGQYFGELFSYFFGSILAISRAELFMVIALAAGTGLFLLAFFRSLLMMTVSEDMALAGGISVRWLDCALLAAVAITVILSVRLVGVVLASALLIVPGAAGHMLSGHYRAIIFISVSVALVAVGGGMALSYWQDWPTGASIVLTLIAQFLFAVSVATQCRSQVFR